MIRKRPWSLQDDLVRGRVAVQCGGKRSYRMFPHPIVFLFSSFDQLGIFPFNIQPLRGISLCAAIKLSRSGPRVPSAAVPLMWQSNWLYPCT
jgi:hypothetical protein